MADKFDRDELQKIAQSICDDTLPQLVDEVAARNRDVTAEVIRTFFTTHLVIFEALESAGILNRADASARLNSLAQEAPEGTIKCGLLSEFARALVGPTVTVPKPPKLQ